MGFMGDFIGVLAFAAIAVLAAVWFFVPFAIFGTKQRLDDLIDAVEEGNKHLADIKAILTKGSADKTEPQQDPDIPSIRASR
ncbi:MAG: hypothetical protein KKA36_00040 [Gammaproteobacteria bacterium]|nr:hypothetical protein [Gammaproteobacteria bacterium]MBU2477451.1 hypothetical protein [Gammaproteobacteria bacterium]